MNPLYIPLITGIVSAMKIAGLPSKFAPIVALLLGLFLAVLLSESAIDGMVAGVASMGLYSGAKKTFTMK